MKNQEEIIIQYLNDSIKRLYINTVGDWIDLYSAETIELKKGEFALISLGVAMQLPLGYEAHMVPRSSTFKTWGIIQTNSFGVIDNTYCGSNDWWKFPALAIRNTKISFGDKICQFRIMKNQPNIIFKESKLLNKSRGGFGSTGII